MINLLDAISSREVADEITLEAVNAAIAGSTEPGALKLLKEVRDHISLWSMIGMIEDEVQYYANEHEDEVDYDTASNYFQGYL